MQNKFEVRDANRKQAKIKIGLSGPSGSGKTYAALKMAAVLAGGWDKVVMIDTENGSGELYSHFGPYKYIQLKPPFSPERYAEAIDAAMVNGAKAIVLDSISHEWSGEGGILDCSDKMTGNSFTNWAKLTPRHNAFINKILQTNAHFFCTTRTKVDYIMEENSKGKMAPRKVGLKEVQREGVDYEFTIMFDLNTDHIATTSKDRTELFDNHMEKLSEATAEAILNWCNGGEPDVITPKEASKIRVLFEDLEVTPEQINLTLAPLGASEIGELTAKHGAVLLAKLQEKMRQVSQCPPKPKFCAECGDTLPNHKEHCPINPKRFEDDEEEPEDSSPPPSEKKICDGCGRDVLTQTHKKDCPIVNGKDEEEKEPDKEEKAPPPTSVKKVKKIDAEKLATKLSSLTGEAKSEAELHPIRTKFAENAYLFEPHVSKQISEAISSASKTFTEFSKAKK